MFGTEGMYFDPLVYLSFRLDYRLFGLDYRWYHLSDITLHAVNGILIFYFIKLISRDTLPALFGSIIFVSSFSASDAVLWSSSRVDLIAAFFLLVSLISFSQYLSIEKKYLYAVSVVAFILALCAKITPIVAPILFIILIFYERKDGRSRYALIIPFVIITILYIGLLILAANNKGEVMYKVLSPNFYTYSLSLASLFIPESILSKLKPMYVFPLIYGFVFLVQAVKIKPSAAKIRTIGLFTMLLFLTPLLALGDLETVYPEDDPYYMLNSPSHRIYLASIGMSIFISGLLSACYKAKKTTVAVSMALFVILIIGVGSYEIRQRERSWGARAGEIKGFINDLRALKPNFPEYSVIEFINPPLPKGFLWPMLKIYYNLEKVTVNRLLNFYDDVQAPIRNIEHNRYFVFVIGSSGLNDFTLPANELLKKRFIYHNPDTDPLVKVKTREEYRSLAASLNSQISNLIY